MAFRSDHLLKRIEAIRDGDHFQLLLNGEEFPWLIAEDGIELAVNGADLPRLKITLLADEVIVSNRLP